MSSNPAHTARRRQLIDWLRERLSESVQLPPEAVRSDLPLSIYGVDQRRIIGQRQHAVQGGEDHQ